MMMMMISKMIMYKESQKKKNMKCADGDRV